MKHRELKWVLAGLLAAVTLGAQATETRNCGEVEVQSDMNICLAQQYAQADTRLNQLYRELVAATIAPRRASLEAVQKAWLNYRTLHCRYVAAPYAGGSIAPAIANDCLLQLTRLRHTELEALLQEARL